MVTSKDIQEEVQAILEAGEYGEDFDVEGLAGDLILRYDLTGARPRDTVDGIDPDEFWRLAADHDMTAPDVEDDDDDE